MKALLGVLVVRNGQHPGIIVKNAALGEQILLPLGKFFEIIVEKIVEVLDAHVYLEVLSPALIALVHRQFTFSAHGCGAVAEFHVVSVDATVEKFGHLPTR